MSTVLTITIPAVIIAYGIYIAVRLIRNRKKGCGCGCSSCPMSGSCHMAAEQTKTKES